MQDPWVENKLASLDPPKTWKPDASQGWTRFRLRQKAERTRRLRVTWAAVAASVVGVGVFLAIPSTCSGAGCVKPGAAPVAVVEPALGPVAVTPPPAESPAPVAAAPAPAPAPAPTVETAKYKESGSLLAPLTIEVYTDYECPHCSTIYMGVMPELVRDYVKTGKARLIHRDFPLNQHPYAKLAARYANAAGTLGHYDAVVHQLFRTQNSWALTGDVGTQVAQVLPPAVMDQVRKLVNDDAHLDDTVNADMAAGREIQLSMTPTMAVTYKGKRQLLAPVPAQYELVKSYLDDLLRK